MNYIVEHCPSLRAFLQLRRDPLAWIARAGRTGTDLRTLRIGARRLVQVNHPDLIRDILITHDWNFVKGRALRVSRPILGQGLLTSEGELHRRQRWRFHLIPGQRIHLWPQLTLRPSQPLWMRLEHRPAHQESSTRRIVETAVSS